MHFRNEWDELIYTHHALKRMLERNIAKGWVEKAVFSPDTVILLRYGQKQAIKSLGHNTLCVVYTEENESIVIISAFWND